MPAAQETLPNGMNVTAIAGGHGDVCGVHLGLAIGPDRVPAHKAGLRAVTQQVLLRLLKSGIAERDDLAGLRQEAGTGGGMRVEMQADYVELAASVTTEALEPLLSLLSSSVFAADWTEDDVVAAKESLADAGGEADGNISAAAQLHSLFERALWGDTVWTRPVWGTPQTRDQITLADVRGFYETYYVPNLASLCIVTPFPESEALRMVTDAFGRHESRQVAAPVPFAGTVTASRVETDTHLAVESAMLLVGVPLPPVGSDGFVRGMVAYGALSGAGGLLASDKTIATGLTLADRIGGSSLSPIDVMPVSLTSHPCLAVIARAVPTAVESTREGILRHILGLAEAPLTQEQLQRAKLRAINLNAIAADGPESLATVRNRMLLVGATAADSETFSARVMAVTAEDLQSFAEEQFTRHAIGLLLPEG